MRVFRFLLPALAVTVAALSAPATANAAYSDPLTTTTKQNLVWHATPASALTALDNALPNVSLNTVVNDANYPMTGCTTKEKAALPKAPAATTALCWDADRAGSAAWVPQGITTSGDADNDGMWGNDKILLSGWHGTETLNRYNDARVMVVNYNKPAAPAFRMAYLAVPNSTGTDFSAAKAHMGGMAWYGDKIYVTAVGSTSTAIRVFSTKHILQMTDSSDSIGKNPSGYSAYGYKYAMMQIGYYSYAGGACSMSSDTGVPCFSSLSLDRSTSPASLVTTEYFSDQSLHGRLFRYDMGSDYLLDANSSGSVAATEAYRSQVGNMQGVLAHNGKWYVAHSSATQAGQLWTQTKSSSNSATCGSPSTTACWATHPESLTYDWSTGLVWSQAEWSTADCAAANQTCGRAIFAVPLTALPA
ncbi:hypothetical protein SAMN05421504_11221 [Amycolatopsis xylanica]|uniref:Secreted protein n=1 Tax=Amycolatopsis xylanica TaxID=589385 RepID=A0A1H3RUM6_9PSEU|nr:hypothetical protein [Amycolatopsis xylanica]SDZ29393.1 hypothetical protein SAMN05421504_11221 [Amycolatopsis xylanica]